MPRAVVAAPAALRDLADIARWLGQPGAGMRARARRLAINRAIQGLGRHPCRYPVGEHATIRERSVAGYRLLYRVVPDTGDDRTAGDVQIIRVFGPGQDRSRL